MRRLVAIAAIVLSSSVAAQNTATLAITGTVNSGQTLAVNVNSNLTGALCALVAGSPGSTTINYGLGSLTLAVDLQAVIPLGMTDATGACGFTQTIPTLPANVVLPNYTLTCQAVVVKFGAGAPTPGGSSGPSIPSVSIQTAVSNTATLVVGTG